MIMSSLKLLEAYSSDGEQSTENDEDEEKSRPSASLHGENRKFDVEAASSSNEATCSGHDEKQFYMPKMCDRLPLPSSLQTMFSDLNYSEPKDNPEDHGGKIRSFPHERGAWATFVYIEYSPGPEFHELIESILEISRSHDIILEPSEHFHISLTRTLKLRYHWIPVFISALNAHLRHLCSFKLMLQSTEVYVNEEKTRTFIGLKVHVGFDDLLKITQKIDKSLEEFHLPQFHKEPSFHLTCASCVGDKANAIELFMADLNVAFQTFIDMHPHSRTVWVKEVYCKSGNKLFCVPLKV